MFWPKAKAGECERIEFPIVFELLIRLEALQGVHRILAPLAVHLAVEIAAVGERLLNLLVALRVRMELIARPGSRSPVAARGLAPGRRF